MEIIIYEPGKRDNRFYGFVGPVALNRRAVEELHDRQYGGMYDEPATATWFFAVEGKKLLGFCAMFDRSSKDVFFDHCYVLPEYRGKGVGNALFAARFEAAKAISRVAKGITMNPVQYQIYLKHGFRLASKRGKYYWMQWEAGKNEPAIASDK